MKLMISLRKFKTLLKMLVNKVCILSTFLIIPIVLFGQKKSFPKDTIYVQYKEKKGSRWNDKFERAYKDENGIYFNIKQEKGDMALFYSFNKKPDTLSIDCLDTFKFSNTEEINKKKKKWIDNKFKGLKHKPYDGTKNAAFQTYLIEVISDNRIIKYPVIWRNEKATP